MTTTSGPKVTLTSYNMGDVEMGDVEERDFDFWCDFVAANIDDACGFAVAVDAYRFGESAARDYVSSATSEQEVAIRDALWSMWCDFCGGGGWDAAIKAAESEATTECTYCKADVSKGRPVPASSDDEAWAREAALHATSCEWIATRAHRVGLSNRRGLLAWAQSTGTTVGQLASHYEGRIGKHGDPTEGGRSGLSHEEALAVAREDASLLYVDLTDEEEAKQKAAEARAAEEAR